MRILIVSDSHGRHYWLEEVVRRVGHIDLLIHLGDSEGWDEYIEGLVDCPVKIVAGNNDFFQGLEREMLFELEGHRIFLTHGHRYGVSRGTSDLVKRGKELGADIVMFGHTHCPCLKEEDGITVLNPGSISLPRQSPRFPSFALMEIDRRGQVHFAQNYIED